MCVIKQVEGGGGGRDSTIFFLVSLAFLVGPVRLKWWGVLYLNFHFLQFAVDSLGGWMCAVGILSFTLLCFVVVSRGFLNLLLTLTNCSRMFLGVQHLEEGWDSCLGA